jgi:hypothetical protein
MSLGEEMQTWYCGNHYTLRNGCIYVEQCRVVRFISQEATGRTTRTIFVQSIGIFRATGIGEQGLLHVEGGSVS